MTESHPLALHLSDLGDYWLVLRCPCGRSTHYPPQLLLERYPATRSLRLVDIFRRLRCEACRRRDGLGLSLTDNRKIGTGSHPSPERVLVPVALR